jgi:hypothetical protein
MGTPERDGVSMSIFPHSTNPIAVRALRGYTHRTSLFLRRFETLGIISIALVVIIGLVYYWLSARAATPLGRFWHGENLPVMTRLQLPAMVMYLLVLLRCIAAGISTTQHLLTSTARKHRVNRDSPHSNHQRAMAGGTVSGARVDGRVGAAQDSDCGHDGCRIFV